MAIGTMRRLGQGSLRGAGRPLDLVESCDLSGTGTELRVVSCE